MKHFEQIFEALATCLAKYARSPIYFCNIHMKQLQHTSETSETLETYTCNMCFHRNISLLRTRVAPAMALTAATTFWWGMASSAAPQQHLDTWGMGHDAQQRGPGV
jgi:hypothetical protein